MTLPVKHALGRRPIAPAALHPHCSTTIHVWPVAPMRLTLQAVSASIVTWGVESATQPLVLTVPVVT